VDVEFMTLLAVRECNDKTLLPPQYQKLIDQREELEKADKREGPRAARQTRTIDK